MNTIQLTKNGFEKLKKELKALSQEKRPIAVKKLADARAMGDLSENSAYSTAKQELRFIDKKIREIERIIRSAEVVENNNSQEIVSFGSCVSVMANGEKYEFEIVGEYEADLADNKLSSTSPIGKALMGKSLNDEVEITVPAGTIVYKIVRIS